MDIHSVTLSIKSLYQENMKLVHFYSSGMAIANLCPGWLWFNATLRYDSWIIEAYRYRDKRFIKEKE